MRDRQIQINIYIYKSENTMNNANTIKNTTNNVSIIMYNNSVYNEYGKPLPFYL